MGVWVLLTLVVVRKAFFADMGPGEMVALVAIGYLSTVLLRQPLRRGVQAARQPTVANCQKSLRANTVMILCFLLLMALICIRAEGALLPAVIASVVLLLPNALNIAFALRAKDQEAAQG